MVLPMIDIFIKDIYIHKSHDIFLKGAIPSKSVNCILNIDTIGTFFIFKNRFFDSRAPPNLSI